MAPIYINGKILKVGSIFKSAIGSVCIVTSIDEVYVHYIRIFAYGSKYSCPLDIGVSAKLMVSGVDNNSHLEILDNE